MPLNLGMHLKERALRSCLKFSSPMHFQFGYALEDETLVLLN